MLLLGSRGFVSFLFQNKNCFRIVVFSCHFLDLPSHNLPGKVIETVTARD